MTSKHERSEPAKILPAKTSRNFNGAALQAVLPLLLMLLAVRAATAHVPLQDVERFGTFVAQLLARPTPLYELCLFAVVIRQQFRIRGLVVRIQKLEALLTGHSATGPALR